MVIDKGAPVNEKDNDGDTPMHWAAKRGDMSTIRMLKEAGGCPIKAGKFNT